MPRHNPPCARPRVKGPAMNRRRITRRTFLAAAGATVAAPAFVRARSLNKLNIAVIGTGGRGASNLAGVSSENIVALCDVNAKALDAAAAKHPGAAAKYKDIVTVSERPQESQPVPAGLDWDLWLGPAPARAFHPVYVPGPKWYRWWDFGNGTMSHLGSHWNDLPFWALKLKAPLTIEASGPPPHTEIAPASMSATYTYGPPGDLPPMQNAWLHGANKPAL